MDVVRNSQKQERQFEMRSTGIAALLAVLSFSAVSAEEPLVTVLDNGLTVITQEMHYAPVVASVISYRVGSRNECGDILGMSHFCEHLMFKGTPDMPKSRFWQIVQRDGGMANAFTSNDCTCYFLLLPSSRLEDALLIESDRMVNCTIDSAEVVSERNVVHEERRMRSIDSPDGALWEVLGEMAYTEHPYRNPVIGYDENILGYDWEKARCYYDTYYCPSNAVLTLVGDFSTEDVLEQVRFHFGSIPSGQVPEEDIPCEPEQTEPRLIEIEHASNLPRFVMAFHAPAGDDPDMPAVSMISSYLSGGRSGRLEQLLVRSGLVHGAGAWSDGGIDPGLFQIYVTMNPPEESTVTMVEVQEMIWTELQDLAENGIPEDRLEELKNRYRAGEILSQASPLGLAMSYSLSATMFDDPLHNRHQLEMVEELAPEDIALTASSIFRRDGLNLAVLHPSGESGMVMGGGRESLPTDITEPSSISYEGLEIPEDFLVPPENSIFEDALSYRLDNGLVIVIKEDHTFPVVSVSFSIPMGGLRHPAALNGLAAVAAETMLRGTEELDYTEFHRRLEMEGSYLRFRTGPRHSVGSVTLLSEDAGTAFQTISDLLLRPAFREEDYSTVMNEQYADLEAAAERAFSVASDSLAAITASTPEDYRNPSRASLDNISMEEVLQFYGECCRPEGSVIAVVGDIETDLVMEMAQEQFGGWKNPDTPLPQSHIPVFSSAAGDTVVTYMPGRLQAAVLVGRDAPGTEMPEYPAFITMNTILGRGIGSRLGHSVRDEQGLAYSVGSWATAFDSAGVFSAYLTTLADYVPQATSSVIEEMRRIASEPVEGIELRLAKANAVGRYAFSGMSYSGQAGGLVDLTIHDRPLDYDIQLLMRVLELQPEDIMSVAEAHFGEGNWFVSIAGGITMEDLVSE